MAPIILLLDLHNHADGAAEATPRASNGYEGLVTCRGLGGCPQPRGDLVSSLGGLESQVEDRTRVQPHDKLGTPVYGRASWRSSKTHGER